MYPHPDRLDKARTPQHRWYLDLHCGMSVHLPLTISYCGYTTLIELECMLILMPKR